MTGPMNVTLAILIGVMVAVASYLLLHRTLTRIALGVGLLGNAINLLLLVAGGPAGSPPFVAEGQLPADAADPLPQAFALTSVVIGFALTAFLLALAWRGWTIDGDDDVEDDLEDRRLAEAPAAPDPASSPEDAP